MAFAKSREVALNCIAWYCLIYCLILRYCLWPEKMARNMTPLARSLHTCIIQHACDICHVGMLRTGTSKPNVPPALQSDSWFETLTALGSSTSLQYTGWQWMKENDTYIEQSRNILKNQGIPCRPLQGLPSFCPCSFTGWHTSQTFAWEKKNDNVKIDSKNQPAAMNSDVSAAFQHLARSAHLLK